MTPLGLLTRSFAVCALAGTLAVACPLGDCDGSHDSSPSAPAQGAGGTPIYSGLTGTMARQVDLVGTPVIPGRVVVLLEHRTGQYPRFWKGGAQHGGIPQRANLQAHLQKFARDLDREIPDRNFDGFVVIDYESWKPFWDNSWANSTQYKEESIRYVRSRFPAMQQPQAEARAKQEFEAAAKEFILATIREGKRLRPNAKWGFYAYRPGSHGDTGNGDDLSWLWNEVQAMYPSLYATRYSRPHATSVRGEANVSEFRAKVRERVEVCQDIADGRPVLAFVHRAYRSDTPTYGGQMINDLDFQTSFLYPVELGVDGLILWDSVENATQLRAIERDLQTGVLGQRLTAAQIFTGEGFVPAERRRAGN